MASLGRCPISSIRCRNRNIGDGTPLFRLWRGGCQLDSSTPWDGSWGLRLSSCWYYRTPSGVSQTIFGYIEKSVDDGIVRIVGLLAVVFGLALIYVGVYVVRTLQVGRRTDGSDAPTADDGSADGS